MKVKVSPARAQSLLKDGDGSRASSPLRHGAGGCAGPSPLALAKSRRHAGERTSPPLARGPLSTRQRSKGSFSEGVEYPAYVPRERGSAGLRRVQSLEQLPRSPAETAEVGIESYAVAFSEYMAPSPQGKEKKGKKDRRQEYPPFPIVLSPESSGEQELSYRAGAAGPPSDQMGHHQMFPAPPPPPPPNPDKNDDEQNSQFTRSFDNSAFNDLITEIDPGPGRTYGSGILRTPKHPANDMAGKQLPSDVAYDEEYSPAAMGETLGLMQEMAGISPEQSTPEHYEEKRVGKELTQQQMTQMFQLQQQQYAAHGPMPMLSSLIGNDDPDDYPDDSDSAVAPQATQLGLDATEVGAGVLAGALPMDFSGRALSDSSSADSADGKDLAATVLQSHSAIELTKVASAPNLGRPLRRHHTADEIDSERERRTDRYGFFVDDDDSGREGATTDEMHRRRHNKINWDKMVANWVRYEKKKQKKIKRRARGGIPNEYRGKFWTELAKIDRAKREARRPGRMTYFEYLRSGLAPSKEATDTIERDINRTFPRHVMFAMTSDDEEAEEAAVGLAAVDAGQQPGLEEGDDGQSRLRRVLRAYSLYDRGVGYCQGMSFLSAMFLMYMPEEDAFWMLVHIMNSKPCEMRELYTVGMIKSRQVLYVGEHLMKHFLPKLYKHFDSEYVHVSMFATQWFITIYTNTFPFDLVTRVWDMFLVEGWKVVYRVMIALLQSAEKKLLRMEFEGIMMFMRQLPRMTNGPDIIKRALKLRLSKKRILALEKKFALENI
mmetsp:Transcript_4055/g.8471  ORF Transcript_4055/g.8471 Transcript_4055/m.8471 type:complete len:775 (+) Transcript_4055:99-2423(+)